MNTQSLGSIELIRKLTTLSDTGVNEISTCPQCFFKNNRLVESVLSPDPCYATCGSRSSYQMSLRHRNSVLHNIRPILNMLDVWYNTANIYKYYVFGQYLSC
jgi:hypothetical protein